MLVNWAHFKSKNSKGLELLELLTYTRTNEHRAIHGLREDIYDSIRTYLRAKIITKGLLVIDQLKDQSLHVSVYHQSRL
jgi:uncharacterized alkaline shock family protein YloU